MSVKQVSCLLLFEARVCLLSRSIAVVRSKGLSVRHFYNKMSRILNHQSIVFQESMSMKSKRNIKVGCDVCNFLIFDSNH